MIKIEDMKAQYITDADGKKKKVVLPIDVFENLLQDLEDLAIAAERRDEESISHDDVIKKLQNDELL